MPSPGKRRDDKVARPGLPGASRNLDVVFGHVRERHQAPLGGDFANPGLAHLESPAWLCDGGIGASEGGVSLQGVPGVGDRVEKAELCSNIVRDSTQNLRASRIFVRVPADILGEASSTEIYPLLLAQSFVLFALQRECILVASGQANKLPPPHQGDGAANEER